MTQHVNVLIATPGHSVMGSYVRSLLATSLELSKRNISWLWLNNYASHVGDAREVTLSGTMENNYLDSRPVQGQFTYDKIIWIDSDIAWTPTDFMKLYESELDIVSGAYLLQNGEVTAYPERFGHGFRIQDVLGMTDPVKVHATGFGFIAVKSGIFEQLSRPWFQSVEVTISDNGNNFTFPIMGEDISWCERVSRLGYDIYLDPTVRVTHHKMMTLSWEGIRP